MVYQQTLLVLSAVLLTTATVNGTIFKPCPGGGTGTVTSVIVNGDTTKAVAQLKKGTNAKLQIVFTAGADSTAVDSVCHGVIGGVPVPFPVAVNGCDGMSPKCPLKSGTTYTFNTVIEVKTLYPSITLVIKWEEVDKTTGKDIVCVDIPAQIIG